MSLRVALWALTLLRVVLLPVFLWLGQRAQDLARGGVDPLAVRLLLVGVLLGMGLSDIADGFLARRHALATQLGAVVDALADKLVQVTIAAWFVFTTGGAFARLPLWFLALVVGRDAFLGVGWLTFRLGRIPLEVVHRPHGRASSVGVFVVFFALVAGMSPRTLPALLIPVAVLVAGSTAAYMLDGLRQLPRSTPGGRATHGTR